MDSRPRIDAAAEQTGQVGDDPAQRVDELHRQVGPAGVSSGTGEPHLDAIARRRDRTGPQPDLPYVDPRIAVQRVDLFDVAHPPVGDDVERPAGQVLFRRLEQQPDSPRQAPVRRELGQHLRCAQ